MLIFNQQGKLRLFEVQVKAIFKIKVSKKVNHDYMGSVWHKKGKQPSRLKTILILRKVRKKVNNSW